MTPAPVCVCGGDRCQDARVLDGTIRCGRLADALDIARAAGWTPPEERRRQKKSTAEEREAAIARVRAGEPVAKVATEVGVNLNTIYAWMARAGVHGPHSTPARREKGRLALIRARAAKARPAEPPR